MEISARSGHELDAVDANIESTPHCSIHLRWRRNFLTSPLLRIPTELIIKIFVHGIELDQDDSSSLDDNNTSLLDIGRPILLVLTATCHQLREIGIASPQLWSTVDFTTLPVAKLLLKRCKYDPHILLAKTSYPDPGWRKMYVVRNPRREAVWEKLEDLTFNNLHSLVFEGTPDELTRRIVGIIQRAPNISNLDLYNRTRPDQELPWPQHLNAPVLHLSTLRLRGFRVSWTSHLLRNLSQLTLDFRLPNVSSKHTSIETFLTALANCPDLQVLNLTHSGPDLPTDRQDTCDVVVQLRRLRKLSLEFCNPLRVGYILSHVGHPESTESAVRISDTSATDLSEAISQILPPQNVGTIQHLRESTELTVSLDWGYLFSVENFLIRFKRDSWDRRTLPRFASKIVEVVGRDTITSLDIETWRTEIPDGTWDVFLHGLPRLERICYSRTKEGDGDSVDPFILAFSRPFEGGPICPRLQHLKLPRVVLTQDSSTTVLKRALTERDAYGKRLKWIGLSGHTEVDDGLVLEPFRDLVDEVR